jgi:hypothetical protein
MVANENCAREQTETLASCLRDPWLWLALVVAALLRAWLPVAWPNDRCLGDECIYLYQALAALGGGAAEFAPKDWLWAPGYPELILTSARLFGSARAMPWIQLVASLVSVALVHRLAADLFGRRAARAAALIFAVHPTFAFLSGRMWAETIYSTLLLSAVASALWCRRGGWVRGLWVGSLLGACILFRGVATYMLPFFALALLWPDTGGSWHRSGRRWRHALAMLASCIAMVAPYSLHASRDHGAFVITDATLGRMMWLGNNDFPPRTYNYVTHRDGAHHPLGRPRCVDRYPGLNPVELDACEVSNGIEWIRSHPWEFARRAPVRLSQLLSPYTFFVRHLRWGRYEGMPEPLARVLVAYTAIAAFAVLLGGTIGAIAWARGVFGLLSVLIVGYHVATVAMLAGLTRYRVPLEALWIIYLAAFAARPRATWERLRRSPARLLGGGAALALLFTLMLRSL